MRRPGTTRRPWWAELPLAAALLASLALATGHLAAAAELTATAIVLDVLGRGVAGTAATLAPLIRRGRLALQPSRTRR